MIMKMFKKVAIIVPLLFVLMAPVAQAQQQDMMIEVASPLGFEETIERLIKNAKGLGWKVPKKWKKNFQRNLKYVTKVDIGKALVLGMCEPHEAVKLLIHDKYKKFLSMMPCTVAIYEKSDGKVYLSMMDIQMMGQMYKGHKEIDEMITKLGPQMEKMLDMN